MSLKYLLKSCDYTLIKGSLNTPIEDVKTDSRQVLNNDLYIALNGYTCNGNDYIEDAINNGAVAIITEEDIKTTKDITIIKIDDARHTLAIVSKNYFNNPQDELTLIGVTGTTGKTTTTHMIKAILDKASIKCGLIGSIGIKYNDLIISTNNTTPDAYIIYSSLRKMADAGITHVIIECSSQAFKLHRLDGITFDIGVLTNITTDHIGPGEHASQAEYVECKSVLFKNSLEVIVNNDSLYLTELLKGVDAPIYTYSLNNESTIQASELQLINDDSFIGTKFNTSGLLDYNFKLTIPGVFNVYNALAAIIVGIRLNISSDVIYDALANFKVKGRMETALITPKFKIIIDYAHTEDAMKNLVETLKAYQPKRLISIFGGGGNRAKERRLSLGRIFGASSDLCIITMDNPRFEDIRSINHDIIKGLKAVNAKYIEIDDRKEAIEYAARVAQEGDLILLIGKGHEEYQEIKGNKYHFSELDIINSLNIEKE